VTSSNYSRAFASSTSATRLQSSALALSSSARAFSAILDTERESKKSEQHDHIYTLVIPKQNGKKKKEAYILKLLY
jgi:hypothetical protein